ncbi:MAG: hypothetical protein F6K57_38815, partial [Moorea sp. SIO4A5]|nr:hypothetical protein [Moorena sp. SIO4A5]
GATPARFPRLGNAHQENRVRAHVFLCMLSYYVEWHRSQALAPILFADEESEQVKLTTTEVVAPSQRSKKALSKARKKKTQDKLPVHSFNTLMADLGTITLNTINTKLEGKDITFEKITQATLLQQKALDLLGISVFCTQ